jgi:hypothetical protein
MLKNYLTRRVGFCKIWTFNHPYDMLPIFSVSVPSALDLGDGTMSSIRWTTLAKQRLRQSIAEELALKQIDPLRSRIERLNKVLDRTFPDSQAIVVQDHLEGFRRRDTLHVLLIEIFNSDTSSPCLVKIGSKEKMEKELAGWESCRPEGLDHDIVLMPLKKGSEEETPPPSGEILMSLVYRSAYQFIGVKEIVNFETAVLRSVLFGWPTVDSILEVMRGLYERISHLLYAQFYEDNPATPSPQQDGFVFRVPKLLESVKLYESSLELRSVRAAANSCKSGIGFFIDPVSYLQYTKKYVRWDEDKASPSVASNSLQLQPTVAALIPRMLRGCAHGDLHGRNILVGIVGDKAIWPAVFDYEDMGPNNLLGWDFVKLETELKIRVYPKMFGTGQTVEINQGEEIAFVREVQQFERELNKRTEAFYKSGDWLDTKSRATPRERLHTILLALRHLASTHLGANRRRPNEWLEEYYFLLVCYGVYTARFSNLQRREHLGAYLSAGVAAARLSWPRQQDESLRALLDLSRPLEWQ